MRYSDGGGRRLDETFWMILGADASGKARGHPTVMHRTRSHATREAERLARENPGHLFFVLRAEASIEAQKPPVKITALDAYNQAPP